MKLSGCNGILPVIFWVLLSCDFKYGVHRMEPLEARVTRSESVLEVIDRELEDRPDSEVLLKRKVNFLENAHWPEGSFEAIRKALEVLPDDGELNYQAALFHFSKDELEEAKNYLVKAGNTGYLTADYFLIYAQVLLRLGAGEEAFKQINRFQQLDPENYRSHHLRGKIYFEQGDTLRAIESLHAAFQLEKENDGLNLQLLDLYLSRIDTTNFFRALNEIQRNDAAWLVKVALLKQDHGLRYDAIRDFKKIMKLDPDYVPARGYLADAYFRVNNYDSAIRYTRIITGMDSTNLQARLIRARSYDRKYNYPVAISEYQQLLAIDSTYGGAIEELNEVYGKVAYLRRLRQEKESIPQFDFTPLRKKEISNN